MFQSGQAVRISIECDPRLGGRIPKHRLTVGSWNSCHPLPVRFHRSIEAPDTARVFRRIFADEARFVHHEPLPAVGGFGDEGAANHTRFCAEHGGRGLHFFVYGQTGLREGQARPSRHPARQTREAGEAIARLHRIPAGQTVFAQQTPEAIDAGVFHNDVIATGNEWLHVYHEQAFVDRGRTIASLEGQFREVTGRELFSAVVSRDELSLDEAVGCYLFNSQLITLPSGAMALIAPSECEDLRAARRVVERMIADPANPLAEARYLDLRQSMRNGGGPACHDSELVSEPRHAQRRIPAKLPAGAVAIVVPHGQRGA